MRGLPTRKRGVGVVEALVAAAIGIVALVGIVSAFSNLHGAARSVELDQNFIDLKQRLRMVLNSGESCRASVAATSAVAGIDIINHPDQLRGKTLDIYTLKTVHSSAAPVPVPALFLKQTQTVGDLQVTQLRFTNDAANPMPSGHGYIARLELIVDKPVGVARSPGSEKRTEISLYLRPDKTTGQIIDCSANPTVDAKLECVSAYTGYGHPGLSYYGPSLVDGGPNDLTLTDIQKIFHPWAAGSLTSMPAKQQAELEYETDRWGLTCNDEWQVTSCNLANGSVLSPVNAEAADGSTIEVARIDTITDHNELYDADVLRISNGCFSDDDEMKILSTLSVTCCRNGAP